MIRTIRVIALGTLGAGMALCTPALADATTLFVGSRVAAPGNSCVNPGYTSIQSALNAAESGNTIEICGGAFKEQLDIEKPVTLKGVASPTISLPGTPLKSETTCDLERNAVRHEEDLDLVSICTTGTVAITGVTFEAKWPESLCDDSLYTVLVAGGATLDATRVNIDGAGAFPLNGCQGGVGIQVGSQDASQVGHASLTKDTVENYQKNGITVDGSGSSASITSSTIRGAGPAPIGQNGIQVSRGAVANISKVEISDNECDLVDQCGSGSSYEWEEDAAGVLFYEAGSPSTVSSSKLTDNDIGVEYVSGSPTLPETPELSLTADQVHGGDASVQLNEGNATLDKDKLLGALVGLDINSYYEEANEYAPVAEVVSGKVEGSRAAVQVESDLGDLPGQLKLTGTKIHGFIVKEDPQFEIIE